MSLGILGTWASSSPPLRRRMRHMTRWRRWRRSFRKVAKAAQLVVLWTARWAVLLGHPVEWRSPFRSFSVSDDRPPPLASVHLEGPLGFDPVWSGMKPNVENVERTHMMRFEENSCTKQAPPVEKYLVEVCAPMFARQIPQHFTCNCLILLLWVDAVSLF